MYIQLHIQFDPYSIIRDLYSYCIFNISRHIFNNIEYRSRNIESMVVDMCVCMCVCVCVVVDMFASSSRGGSHVLVFVHVYVT